MSEPTLWRRCERCNGSGYEASGEWCVNCGASELQGYLPVAVGAVLIEDGLEAAVNRGAPLLAKIVREGLAMYDSPWDTMGKREREWIRTDLTMVLRAACGEGT